MQKDFGRDGECRKKWDNIGKKRIKCIKMVMIHFTGQPKEVQYWQVVVLDDLEIKFLLVSGLHFVPYFAHLGVQRMIRKV